MMFKSKHSGWTWDLKRTPFGGGGGDIFQSVGNTLASIDPGPAIESGLAEVDKGVNQIPGGWYTLGALAAGGTGLAFAPELAAAAGLGEGATITSAAGQQAFFDALASGATSTEAISAGAAADAAAIGTGTNAALQGPTYGELGVTGVPEGGMGPTYAEMGNTGLNTQQAISAADSAAQLQQAKDALTTANDVRKGVSTANNLAKLLSQGAGSGLTSSLGKLAAGANPIGAQQLQIVRGNQSPFVYTAQQPIQNTNQTLASLLKQG
jgi:hypothetical protein